MMCCNIATRAGCPNTLKSEAKLFCSSENISDFVSPISYIFISQYYDVNLNIQNFTLVKLNEGDTVHKSIDDYHKSLQKTMISKMSKDTEKYLDQTKKDTLLLEEIKENTKQMRELQRILKSKK